MYMEDPMNFSNYEISENINDDFENDQESGWTWYLQDDNYNYNTISSSFSSLASDAASLADPANHQISINNYNFNTINNKSKTRRRHHNYHHLLLDHDDALEDTATSPVNSPKVSDQLNKSTKQRYHAFNISSEEKVNMGLSRSDDDDDGDNVDLIIGRESELKKKGLCLVPLSMVLNHFG